MFCPTIDQHSPTIFPKCGLQYLFDLLASDKIKPEITERFFLDDAIRAHELIESGNVRGRLVFVTQK